MPLDALDGTIPLDTCQEGLEMSATFELYSRWKNAKGHKSDRQGAIALGVSPQTVQFWKDGRNGQPDIIEKMARDLDEDPIKTILAAYAEKETGNSKKVLVKLSKRFGAVVLAAQLGAAAYPVEATNNGAELYIMRSTAKRRTRYCKGSFTLRGNSWKTNQKRKAGATTCRRASA